LRQYIVKSNELNVRFFLSFLVPIYPADEDIY
jgi:hypothetical protein